MKPVTFTAAALPQWVKLSPDVRRRIIKGRLEAFAESGKGEIKRLRGRAGARLRIGDWRVIFYEEKGEIIIVAVGHRSEICH
jgi:mRNA interferase RelE/StbE